MKIQLWAVKQDRFVFYFEHSYVYYTVALNYGVFRRNYFNSTATHYVFFDMGAWSSTATVVSKYRAAAFLSESWLLYEFRCHIGSFSIACIGVVLLQLTRRSLTKTLLPEALRNFLS